MALYGFVGNSAVYHFDALGDEWKSSDYKSIWPGPDPRGGYRGADGRYTRTPPPPPPLPPGQQPRLAPPPPGIPSEGENVRAGGICGAAEMCADALNDRANELQVQEGIRICRAEMGTRSVGEKCCVLNFCNRKGCFTGKNTQTRVGAYLWDQPCKEVDNILNAPGPQLKIACQGTETLSTVYEQMVKLATDGSK